jgi:hypothetical protein
MVPITVIAYLIGFENPDLNALLRTAFESTALFASILSKQELLGFKAFSEEVNRYLGEQLSNAPPEGQTLLSATARAVSDGVISHAEGRVLLSTLLSAGGG